MDFAIFLCSAKHHIIFKTSQLFAKFLSPSRSVEKGSHIGLLHYSSQILLQEIIMYTESVKNHLLKCQKEPNWCFTAEDFYRWQWDTGYQTVYSVPSILQQQYLLSHTIYGVSCNDFITSPFTFAVMKFYCYISAVYRCSAMTATISYYYKMLWMLVYEGVLALPDFGRSIFNWFSGRIPYGNENIMDN